MRLWFQCLALAFLVASPTLAAPPDNARALATEIQTTATAATSVIAALQGKINGASASAADIDPAALAGSYRAAYQRLAGHPPDAAADPAILEIRGRMEAAMAEVLAQFRADILRGGTDAFVPAFFRAQLFDRFNAAVAGRFRAVATNRRAELINADSAVDRLIDDAAITALTNTLVESGTAQVQIQAVGDRLVGYWPMTITEPCASCHLRSGLRQDIGQFGGATIIVVGR